MDDFWNDDFRLYGGDESDYSTQLEAALSDAIVMSIFFMRVGSSLILDFRCADDVGPAVIADGMTPSPRARLYSFRRLRPQLPIPDEITLAPWPERVRDFEREGLLSSLLSRCDDIGGRDLASMARNAYLKILAEEQKMLRDIVRGAGMETIWERP